MGLFGFFKGKVEDVVEVENISFDKIEKWLEDRNENLRKDEVEILDKIEEKLKAFYVSLEEKLEVLESVDIESKKEHGRAKILVRQGLDKYIDSVHILLKNLKELKKDDLEKFAREISETFISFEKISAKVYERATYLVGDEMATVRNEIRRFYNGLVEKFNGDELSIKSLREIRNIRLKLDEFKNLEKNIREVKIETEINKERIEKAKKNVKKLMSDVERIKNSSEYISNLETEEKIKFLRTSLNNEIVKLKDAIDFKKLTGIIHTNEKELGIVKDYKNHFVSEFSRDGGKRILDLLESSNMKSAKIETYVLLIEKINNELKEKSRNVGLDSTIIKLEEIEKIEDGIDGMKTEKVKIERKVEEFYLKLKGLKNEIVRMVEEIGNVKIV